MALISPPVVSVVIPTHNRGFCIAEAIESVLAQSLGSYEIVVVDDGSTDETKRVVAQFGARVRYLYQSNAGVSAARNAGIAAAKGEFIAFLDSDDEWIPDKLRLQCSELSANTTAVAHMVDAKIADQDGFEGSLFELRGVQSCYELQPLRFRPLLDVLTTQFFTSTWMVRRSAIEGAGHFNPSMRIFEDLEYLCRVALCGPFVASTLVGTNMRRRRGPGGSLSDLYETSRLESLENLVSIYENLTFDSRLTRRERKFVQKQLGSTHLDKAVILKKSGHRFAYFDAAKGSLKADHSPFGIAKNLALILLGGSAYERLQRLRNVTRREVRRSKAPNLR